MRRSRARPPEPPFAHGLGKAVSIRRIELGLSRQQLAERSGLSYPYVSEIENAVKGPSQKALVALARGLDVATHELVTRAEQRAIVMPPAQGQAHDRAADDRAVDGE